MPTDETDMIPSALSVPDRIVLFVFSLHVILASSIGMALFVDTNDPSQELSLVYKLYYYGTFLSGGFVSIATLPRIRNINYRTGVIFVTPFILICIFSIAYSRYPIETRTYAVRIVSTCLAVAGASRVFGPVRILRVLVFSLSVVGVSSFFVSIFIPSIGVHSVTDQLQSVHAGHWRGITGHKNTLGRDAGLLTVLLIFYSDLLFKSRIFSWILVAISLINMGMAQSGTAITCSFAGVVFYFFIFRGNQSIYVTSAKVIASIAVVAAVIFNLDLWLALLGRDETFSGRSDIWAYSWGEIQKRLYFGNGYGAGIPFFQERSKVYLFSSAVDPHNSYFYLMLDVGVVGATCLIAAILAAVVTAIVGRPASTLADVQANKAFALCLCMLLTIAITETAPFDICSDVGIVTFISIIAISRPKRSSDQLGRLA